MAKITISTSNQAGDIPTYNYTKDQILNDYFSDLETAIENSDDKVFVCFQSWSDTETDYSFEHQSILITMWIEDALFFMEQQVKDMKCEEINFNFFCFENYKEAFLYSIDLKEGL